MAGVTTGLVEVFGAVICAGQEDHLLGSFDVA